MSLDEDPLPPALLGRLLAKTGRREQALNMLDRLRHAATTRYVSPYNFAIVYLGLGQKEDAIRFLEQIYEARDGYNIVYLKTDPLLDDLHGDARFEALAQKVFGGK